MEGSSSESFTFRTLKRKKITKNLSLYHHGMNRQISKNMPCSKKEEPYVHHVQDNHLFFIDTLTAALRNLLRPVSLAPPPPPSLPFFPIMARIPPPPPPPLPPSLFFPGEAEGDLPLPPWRTNDSSPPCPFLLAEAEADEDALEVPAVDGRRLERDRGLLLPPPASPPWRSLVGVSPFLLAAVTGILIN